MSHLYNVTDSDGLATFITDLGDTYSSYFLEYPLLDADGNEHIVLNFDFLCNENFECKTFTKKHDLKIKNTFINLISNYFDNHEHAVIVYFCYNRDGLGRHRSITFRKWLKELPGHISKTFNSTEYNSTIIYSSMLIVESNPLKKLILDAFEQRLLDLAKISR